MKIRIYPALIALIDLLGLNALYRRRNRDKAIILWYHGVCPDGFDFLEGFGARHLAVSVFRKQMEHLKRCGYAFVTLTELCDRLANGEDTGGLVTLTFDDGFRNVVETAYPVMAELGLKGCFYLVTDRIGGDDILWTDRIDVAVLARDEREIPFRWRGEEIVYPLDTGARRVFAVTDIKTRLKSLPEEERLAHMEQFADVDLSRAPREFRFADWDEIRSLDPEILEIGSHTRRHPSLANVRDDARLDEELAESKAKIEAEVGRPCRHFCYPSGSFSDATVRRLEEAGYASATTVRFGFVSAGDDPLRLNRISFSEDFRLFKAYVSGAHELASKITGLLRGGRS